MIAGQFVRGKIDGIQKEFESRNLSSILPREKLQDLASKTEIGEYPKFFKEEKVLTKTVVTPADNSDGRKGGVINHTVLYRFSQTVKQDTINYVFPLEEFINEIVSGKRQFKMPPKPELPESNAGIIDAPPEIEWEVEC